MASNFFGGSFFGGGYFGASDDVVTKTGTGGIDPPKRRGKNTLHLPYKPTGLINRPIKTKVDVRVEETRQIHQEISEQVASEFVESQSDLISDSMSFSPVTTMTLAQIDDEIGALMRKQMLNDDEEIMLLLLLAASV